MKCILTLMKILPNIFRSCFFRSWTTCFRRSDLHIVAADNLCCGTAVSLRRNGSRTFLRTFLYVLNPNRSCVRPGFAREKLPSVSLQCKSNNLALLTSFHNFDYSSYSKHCASIIYFVFTYFIIVVILSLTYLFTHLR
jgi:hypothetical protein